MSENDMLNGDDEHYSQGEGEDRVCRDFMRNVCNRGNNCKFIHPHDIKIRNDPIFCHDYQQTKCFRSTCKFIHCSREEEEHYKGTGELPETFTGGDGFNSSRGRGMRGKPSVRQNGSNGRGGGVVRGGGRGGGRPPMQTSMWESDESSEIPLCKDYLKGVCDRPPGGCKFRHAGQDTGFGGGGGRGGAANRRRPGAPSYYDGGPPETKRSNNFGGVGRGATTRITEYEQFDDYYNPEYSNPPAPTANQNVFAGNRATYGTTMMASHHSATSPSYMSGRNGYGSFTNSEVVGATQNPYATTVFAATTTKVVEDENFMLKRRIEELKKQVSDLVATNEYLLSQNAHLRLSNMNVNVGAIMAKDQMSVTGAGGVTGTSVVQTLVSMAQPIGITPSLSVAATPISLSSISSGPTVVSLPAASISQPLPVVSMSHQPQSVYPMASQGVLPPP